MKFIWKGSWRNGELLIEAQTLGELNEILDELFGSNSQNLPQTIIPVLPSGLGCSDSIKKLLESECGKHPRLYAEIKNAFESNALYFSKGTLSGTLRFLEKRGDIKRFKKAGKWAYVGKGK